MTKNKQLVPKRRFKEFENDGEWMQKRLGDIATEIIAGGDIDRSKISKSGKYPVLANALSNNGVLGYYKKDYRVTAPAVTVTGRGDIGHAKARRTNFTPVVRLLAIKSKYDVDFLENVINNQNSFVESTGVPQLTVPKLSDYTIYVPENIYEGNTIGHLINRLDDTIDLQHQKINKNKEIKSAYLSVMFPKEGEKYPKKRFDGFTEPWEKYKLGEVANIKTGNTNVQDAVQDGKYTFFDRSTEIKKINKYYYDEETIIYPGEGSEFYPRYFKGKYALHQRAYSITSDNINLKYLSHMLLLRNNHFLTTAVGSTVKSLRMDNFNKCDVWLPSLKEQEKIANLLFNLDAQIDLEKRKLNKLEQLKQAYLNELFV